MSGKLKVLVTGATGNTGSHHAERANVILDHALLAEGAHLDDPAAYVRRMNALLLDLDSGASSG